MKVLIEKIITSCLIVLVCMLAYDSTPDNRLPYIDPVLKPYVYEWIEDCNEIGIDGITDLQRIDSILYTPLFPGYWGLCVGDGTTLVASIIDPFDADMLRLVVYHELGHCAFGYEHLDTAGYDIMNSVLPREDKPIYAFFWSLLKQSYFDRYEPEHRHREDPCIKKELD